MTTWINLLLNILNKQHCWLKQGPHIRFLTGQCDTMGSVRLRSSIVMVDVIWYCPDTRHHCSCRTAALQYYCYIAYFNCYLVQFTQYATLCFNERQIVDQYSTGFRTTRRRRPHQYSLVYLSYSYTHPHDREINELHD